MSASCRKSGCAEINISGFVPTSENAPTTSRIKPDRGFVLSKLSPELPGTRVLSKLSPELRIKSRSAVSY